MSLTFLLSTTIDISWAENGFRLWSIVFGLYTIFMVVWSIIFALKESIQLVTVILLDVFLLTYLIPLLINIRHLMFFSFIKGILCLAYLSATYINIFTIFSILNIHDVSLGSRPTGENSKAFYEVERKKQFQYKNFRANFLFFWMFVNLIIGYGVSKVYTSQYNYVLFYIFKK